MAKRGKGRRKFVERDNPHADPLGIGLSTKALCWIGGGVVVAILVKKWLDKRAAAASPADGGATGQPGGLQPQTPSAPPAGTPTARTMPMGGPAIGPGGGFDPTTRVGVNAGLSGSRLDGNAVDGRGSGL